MNRDPDRLDAAIDDVAKRLVAVPGNEAELTQHIISALPDRSSRLRGLIPQFVALGAIVIAAFAWTLRHQSLTRAPKSSGPQVLVATTSVPSSTLAPLSPFATTKAPNRALRTELLEPLAPLEPLEPLRESLDFEHSLSPIAPVNALALSDMSLSAIAAPAAIDLAPIEIRDIPTMAEIPPRQQE